MSGIHSFSIAVLPPLLVCCQHTLKIFPCKSTLADMAWVLLHENMFDFFLQYVVYDILLCTWTDHLQPAPCMGKLPMGIIFLPFVGEFDIMKAGI